MAYHGGQMNIPVTVVMPIVAPIMKVENCKKYGANVIIHGADIGESRLLALKIGHKKGMQYINGYDHPNILAGQGTMGLEILAQVPDVDAIIIPVGGGGLIAGTAMAVKTLKPDVIIIGSTPTSLHHHIVCRCGAGGLLKLLQRPEAREGRAHPDHPQPRGRTHGADRGGERSCHRRTTHRQDGDGVGGVDRHIHPASD